MDKLTPPQIARLAVYVHRAITENPPERDADATESTKMAIATDGLSYLWEWFLMRWVDGEEGNKKISDPLPKYFKLLCEHNIAGFLIDYYAFD